MQSLRSTVAQKNRYFSPPLSKALGDPMFRWLSKIFRKPEPERVIFDDTEITRYSGDEIVEKIDWASITEISVITTDEGPWAEDAFIVLSNPETEQGCLVPNGAEGTADLVSKLCKMPGFDEKKFIQAMGCTTNNKFLCWSKSEAT